MPHRALALALYTTLLLGFAAPPAGGQGFASVSSLPPASAPPAVTPPGALTVPPNARAVTAPFSSVSSPPSLPPAAAEEAPASGSVSSPPLLPPAAATLAFSSVSTLNAGPGATGGGPSLPVVAASSLMADRILVEKGKRRLYLLNRGRVIAEYPVKLGLSPKGHKQFEGDFRTPEGVYHLSRRNPRSEFFLSVEVSYPNEADRARALAEGVRPGGLIMIHGQPNVPRKPADYYAGRDWTDGCIAVTNSAMVDIWQRTRIGIPIEIRP
jgi:hypothetical protein